MTKPKAKAVPVIAAATKSAAPKSVVKPVVVAKPVVKAAVKSVAKTPVKAAVKAVAKKPALVVKTVKTANIPTNKDLVKQMGNALLANAN